MKKRGILSAAFAALLIGVATQANAQQRPQPVPTPQPAPTDGTTTAAGRHHYPPLRFPATAARYEIYVHFLLDTIRKAAGHRGITQGDVNKAVLTLKDCTSKIEADGYVTQNENQYCMNVFSSTLHELATPYLLQAEASH